MRCTLRTFWPLTATLIVLLPLLSSVGQAEPAFPSANSYDLDYYPYRWCPPTSPGDHISITYSFGCGLDGVEQLAIRMAIQDDVMDYWNDFVLPEVLDGAISFVGGFVSADACGSCVPDPYTIVFRMGDLNWGDLCTYEPPPGSASHPCAGGAQCGVCTCPTELPVPWTATFRPVARAIPILSDEIAVGSGLFGLVSVIIDINPTFWTCRPYSQFVRTLRHEVGHALGLGHYSQCPPSGGLMCTPSASDYLLPQEAAVLAGLYGYAPLSPHRSLNENICAQQNAGIPSIISTTGLIPLGFACTPSTSKGSVTPVYDLFIREGDGAFSWLTSLSEADWQANTYAHHFSRTYTDAIMGLRVRDGEEILFESTTLWPQTFYAASLSADPLALPLLQGGEGGPFSPVELEYAVANNSGAVRQWSATTASPWLDLGTRAGLLEPGERDTISVRLEETAAAALPPGQYFGAWRIFQIGSPDTITRWVVLEVAPCQARPAIQPDALAFEVPPGQSACDTTILMNPSLHCGDLPFSLSCEVLPGAGNVIDLQGSTDRAGYGDNRYKGNVYHVLEATTLSKVESYLYPGTSGTRQLHFVVLSASSQAGPYTLVESQVVTRSAVGGAFYASDPMTVPLSAGSYYIVAVGWTGGNATWYYDVDAPDPVSFGEKLDGFEYLGYPLPSTVASPSFVVANYHQRLTTGVWLSAGPASGTIPAGGEARLAVCAEAGDLPDGIYLGWIRLSASPGGAPLDSIPVAMTVGTPGNDPLCAVAPASVQVTMRPDAATSAVLAIGNEGTSGSVLVYELTAQGSAPAKVASPAKSVAGSTITCAENVYLPGTSGSLHFTVRNGTPDDEWLTDVQLDFPPGMQVTSSSNFVGGSVGPMISNGAVGDGAAVSWHGDSGPPDYYGVVRMGETATATVGVTFGGGLAGPQTISYSITGDQWGSTPHTVTGSIVLLNGGASLHLQSPNGGERLAVGASSNVTWESTGGLSQVRIDLSRNGGASWEAVTAATVNDGVYQWPVGGATSAACLLKVSSLDLTVSDRSDAVFAIHEPVPWLTASRTCGILQEGETHDLELRFDSTGLAEGQHQAWVVVDHNGAGSPTVVPVTLVVDARVGVPGDLPAALWLDTNRPNPFNPQTRISFGLPGAGRAVLRVYDLAGRLVRTVWSGELPAGRHELTWDGRDEIGRAVASGVYFCNLAAGKESRTVKMTLLR